MCVFFLSGSEKRGLLEKGSFRKVHLLEILEKEKGLEFLENPRTVENPGESDHFLEILEIVEILEIPPFVMTPFSSPKGEVVPLQSRQANMWVFVAVFSE